MLPQGCLALGDMMTMMKRRREKRGHARLCFMQTSNSRVEYVRPIRCRRDEEEPWEFDTHVWG